MFHIKILILGFLLVFTLVFASSVKNDYVNGEDKEIEYEWDGTDETKEHLYCCQFVFLNLEALEEEKDLIVVYNKNGDVYGGGYIHKDETNFELTIPVEEFYVTTQMLGTIEVHNEENRKTRVYIDYQNKTISQK